MRITIDARLMGAEQTRGIGRYVEELIRAMQAQADVRWRFCVLMREPQRSPFSSASNIAHVQANVPWYGWQEQRLMPALYKATRPDLVHIPHWNMPILYRGPLVMTIHDLLLRHQPSSAKASTQAWPVLSAKRCGYRVLLREAVRRARKIFVPTQFVADDIRRWYPRAAQRACVTGEGVTRLPAPDAARLPDGPFLLYVGSAYPHKRLDLLLDAWPQLSRLYPGLYLVMAGEKDVFMRRYAHATQERGMARVEFLGRVSDAELSALYAQALALVFPSSHEGFGLPPVEALSQGCPVVASDISCLTETLSGCEAFFFRNGDPDDMMRAIHQVLLQAPDLRSRLQLHAPRLLERYAWRDVAHATLRGYEQALD